MEIKVYKDGSKIKSKIFGGFTFRQFLALSSIGGGTVLLMVNTFVLHLNDTLMQMIISSLLMIVLFLTLVKINGVYGNNWLKIKWRYMTRPKVRTYRTERIITYDKNEFRQKKEVKETTKID